MLEKISGRGNTEVTNNTKLLGKVHAVKSCKGYDDTDCVTIWQVYNNKHKVMLTLDI